METLLSIAVALLALLLGAGAIFGLSVLISFIREDILGQEPYAKRVELWATRKERKD